MTNERIEQERAARVAALDDAAPPESQYHVRNARTVRDVLEALASLAGEIDPATRANPLQSPLPAFYDVVADPNGPTYSAASGATKAVPAEVTAHRPRVRSTRSRKGRSSYVVTRVAAVTVSGIDPVRGMVDTDGAPFHPSPCPHDGGSRIVDVPSSWTRHDAIVTMLGRDLVALADSLYDIPALIGGIDGRRNSWHFESDRMVRERKPSNAERAADLMTPRDIGNPSIARWSGDLLAYFPEVRDRLIAPGDDSTWSDAVASDTSSRAYNRPLERHRTRQGLRPVRPRTSVGELESIVDPADPAAACICDGATVAEGCRAHTRVMLIGPSPRDGRAFIGHRAYDRPVIESADPAADLKAARERTAGMSETPEAIAAIDAATAAMSDAVGPVHWDHGRYTVHATPDRDGRWTLNVYNTPPATSRRVAPSEMRVMRRKVRNARAAGLALLTLPD